MLLLAGCSDYELVAKQPDVDPGLVTECGFTRAGDSAFYVYDCNPVFTTTDEEWAGEIGSTAFAVTEVLGHPFYQLWYVGFDEDAYALGYAASPAGTDWRPHPRNPGLGSDDAQDFDATVMQAIQALWDPETRQYVMLYSGLDLGTGGGGGTGIATSPDGVRWERIPENPVLPLEADVEGVTSWCWPLDLNLGTSAGFSGYIAGANRAGACEAYTLGGSDIDTWTVAPDLVFAAGERGAWDDQGLIALNTAVLGEEEHLFYVGFGDWEDHDTYRVALNSFVGQATRASDGSWERDPDPLPLNMTAEGEVSAVAAVTVGKRVALWITDVYDGASGVGYFLYDPEKAARE